MNKVTSSVVALVLVFGLTSVNADLATCFSLLQNVIQAGGFDCNSMETYVKCVLKETGFSSPIIATDESINLLQSKLKNALAPYRLSCNFDIRSMIQEIQQDNAHHGNGGSTLPTDYNSATTLSDCLNVFVSHASFTCREFNKYMNCIVRTLDLGEQQITDNLLEQIQSQLNSNLAQHGLHCHVDLKSAMKEKQSNKGGDGSVFSYRPFHLVTLILFTALSVIVVY